MVLSAVVTEIQGPRAIAFLPSVWLALALALALAAQLLSKAPSISISNREVIVGRECTHTKAHLENIGFQVCLPIQQML